MNKISRCNICGEFLNSKRELKRHKDKNHRISALKIAGLSADLLIIITIVHWFYAVIY
jgi:hypothetical protein